MKKGFSFPPASTESMKNLLFVIIIGLFIFNMYNYQDLTDYQKDLEVRIDTDMSQIHLLTTKLDLEKKKNRSLSNNLESQKEVNQQIQSQVETITSSVSILEKLSKTDSELLKKYSKIYFLNENYSPASLTTIETGYLMQEDKQAKILTQVWPHLKQLLDDAKSAGLDLKILSSYRSFGEQAALKNAYTVSYGSGANKFSADQGYSEHQLGTAVDFNTKQKGAVLTGFEKTPEYTWLSNNAYKYGFIVSYPKENKYYIFEPWHWRFVGVNLATQIHNENTYFYALEQRNIDGYLVDLFN